MKTKGFKLPALRGKFLKRFTLDAILCYRENSPHFTISLGAPKEVRKMPRIDRQAIVERRTQRIHEYLKSDLRYNGFFPRPFFIEFGGSPSSGKTTVIKELDRLLRRKGLRVRTPQEGAEAIRHIPRTDPVYNIRTSLKSLTELIDESEGHAFDVVIFDRGLFDAYYWMRYWQHKGKMSPEMAESIHAFLLLPFWTHRIDIAYFMLCDAEEALKKEMKYAVSNDFGRTTNPETIALMLGIYREAYRVLKPRYKALYLEDTTHLNPHEMVARVAERTLRILTRAARNH